MRLARQLFLAPVYLYRYTLSALIGRTCRHMPSCSEYMIEAVNRHGIWAGGWMGFARICRCRPGGTSGLDFVCESLPPDAHMLAPWRYGLWRSTWVPPGLVAADPHRPDEILPERISGSGTAALPAGPAGPSDPPAPR